MTEVSKVNKYITVGDPGLAVAKIVKYIVMDLSQPTEAPTPPNRKVQVFARIGQR